MKVTSQGCGKQTCASIEVESMLAGLSRGNDLDELVGQMAVGLKKRSGANAVGGALRLIGQMSGTGGHQNFGRSRLAVSGIRFAEGHHASDRRERGAEFLGPFANRRAAGFAGACDLEKKLSVVGVREEFDLTHSPGNFAGASVVPQRSNAAVNERRTNGTLVYRQQLVRGKLEISQCERRSELHLQARAIAIVPRWRGVNFNVEGQVEFRRAAQSFAQDFLFDFDLVLVRGVLIVTSAALTVIGTGRLHAVRGSLNDCISLGSRKSRFLLGESGFDFFVGENEGDEDGFAAGTVVAGRIGGKTGQAVAAVDHLFNSEEQEV